MTKCKIHPKYQATREPKVPCKDCWRLWFNCNEPKIEYDPGPMVPASWRGDD